MSEDNNSMPDDTTPKTPRPRKKENKKDNKKKSVDPDNTLIESDEEFINKLLQSAIIKYAGQVEHEHREHRKDVDAILPILTEFLDDFLILGHTIAGQRVIVKYAPSQRTVDCLENVIKEFITQAIYGSDRID